MACGIIHLCFITRGAALTLYDLLELEQDRSGGAQFAMPSTLRLTP